MKAVTIIPVLLAALAAGALWLYLPIGREVKLPSREPQSGPAAAQSAPAGASATDRGRLIVGTGKASNLPGLWPAFRGTMLDGVGHEDTPLAQA